MTFGPLCSWACRVCGADARRGPYCADVLCELPAFREKIAEKMKLMGAKNNALMQWIASWAKATGAQGGAIALSAIVLSPGLGCMPVPSQALRCSAVRACRGCLAWPTALCSPR